LGETRQKRTSLATKTELGEKNETSAGRNKSAVGRTGNPTRTETTTKSTHARGKELIHSGKKIIRCKGWTDLVRAHIQMNIKMRRDSDPAVTTKQDQTQNLWRWKMQGEDRLKEK
jgi:hypothetical protein